MLTFVIPVRHHESVDDWPAVVDRMAETLRSVASQSVEDWECVVVANRGTPLPPMPRGCRVVEVGTPHAPLPTVTGAADQHARDEAVRSDKGHRILAGLLEARPTGHVMVVDYDDLVHHHLAELSAALPDRNGWFADQGYCYDGHLLYKVPSGFNTLCGTSLIVRADLLRLPRDAVSVDEAWVRRWLGSHMFLREDLAAAGTPLAPLPFPGAIYRVGHQGSTSGTSTSIRRWFFRRRLVLTPHVLIARLLNLRRVAPAVRAIYFGESLFGAADMTKPPRPPKGAGRG